MLLTDYWIRELCTVRPKVDKIKMDAWGFYCGIFDVDFPMIEPFSEAVSGGGIVSFGLTSAGYDLRLAGDILVFKDTHGEVIDPREFCKVNDPGGDVPGWEVMSYSDRVYEKRDLQIGEAFIIPPRSYILGSSLEYLRVPKFLKGRCTGKSTLARAGILVNTTPLEPEWEGHLTIEIGNITPCPVRLRVGEGICQLEFELLNGLPEISYKDKGGIYQAQKGVTPPRVRM